MVTWIIEYQGYSAPLERVTVPAIRQQIDPIKDELATILAGCDRDGEALTVAFVLDGNRRLSLALRGDQISVQRARDVLGRERKLSRLMN